jgi:hypothetical protein
MLLLTDISGEAIYFYFNAPTGSFAVAEQSFLTSDCTGTGYIPDMGAGARLCDGTFVPPRTDGTYRNIFSRRDEFGTCIPLGGGSSPLVIPALPISPQPGWVEPLQMVLVEPVLPPSVAAGGTVLVTLIAAGLGWVGYRRVRS